MSRARSPGNWSINSLSGTDPPDRFDVALVEPAALLVLEIPIAEMFAEEVKNTFGDRADGMTADRVGDRGQETDLLIGEELPEAILAEPALPVQVPDVGEVEEGELQSERGQLAADHQWRVILIPRLIDIARSQAEVDEDRRHPLVVVAVPEPVGEIVVVAFLEVFPIVGRAQPLAVLLMQDPHEEGLAVAAVAVEEQDAIARGIVVEVRREQPDRLVPVGEQVEGRASPR